jgi:glycerol-3-phosphate dehydrogenase
MSDSHATEASMLWNVSWRDRMWDELPETWDVIVIGGGITGAGILREAARNGWRVLLVEANDFGSGTSSRSSKLVHGGLRYLRDGKLRLTLISVRERQQLLKQGRGLVNPLGFLLANYKGDRIPAWVFGIGLILYDLMGLQWGHRQYDPDTLRSFCPQLSAAGLEGGFRYFDAQTDDARLVLRVIREAVLAGGFALNYARVEELLTSNSGQVHGVVLRDQSPVGRSRTAELHASQVINATGAWTDTLRTHLGHQPRMRKLRGSHLVFPWASLPLTRAVTFLHPRDGRPVFAFPWEGVTLFGTTDVEHKDALHEEPRVSTEEVAYLSEGITYGFPGAFLGIEDLLCSFAGVRGVIDTGKRDPSRESREHVLWDEKGLLTVTGGKLTTFQAMAHDALRIVRKRLPPIQRRKAADRVLDALDVKSIESSGYPATTRWRLAGRYGHDTINILALIEKNDDWTIGDSPHLCAELRWAARAEAVVHLSDLLLRRVRVGLTLPEGGLCELAKIRALVQPELGWDDDRWQREVAHYQQLWRSAYMPQL